MWRAAYRAAVRRALIDRVLVPLFYLCGTLALAVFLGMAIRGRWGSCPWEAP